MLCIALVAVFALDLAETAVPCSNADCSAACDFGGCDDQDTDGAPCVKHHCCHGASAAEPNIQGASLPNGLSTKTPQAAETFVVPAHLDALERPPRAFTAI